MSGGGPIIGTGWELYMYQTFLDGEPVTLPGALTYMGCYPYEYMTYDVENDTYIYLRNPDRFRVMSRDRTSGFYLSQIYDPFCMYHPGDNKIHFTVGAVVEDFPRPRLGPRGATVGVRARPSATTTTCRGSASATSPAVRPIPSRPAGRLFLV